MSDSAVSVALVKQTYRQAHEIDELDGITVQGDDWWFNVRPSNTEPLLRLNVEAKSPELMATIRDQVLALFR